MTEAEAREIIDRYEALAGFLIVAGGGKPMAIAYPIEFDDALGEITVTPTESPELGWQWQVSVPIGALQPTRLATASR